MLPPTTAIQWSHQLPPLTAATHQRHQLLMYQIPPPTIVSGAVADAAASVVVGCGGWVLTVGVRGGGWVVFLAVVGVGGNSGVGL